MVNECQCTNCMVIHLLGETFNGKRCCGSPKPKFIGKREVVEYTKTNEEEKADFMMTSGRLQ